MHLSPVAIISICLVFPALSQAGAGNLSPAEFAASAASSDAFEIQAGQLAQKKGQQAKVKEFGKMMVEHHTQSSAALKQAAQEEGVSFNATLTPELQAKLTSLEGASGPTFDAAYFSTQISVHTKAAELFSAYAKNGTGGPIKAFAENTLPVIRTHLVRAQGMSAPSDQ